MVNEIYEYIIDKKSEGKYKLARIAMLSLYVAFVLAFFLVCYISRFIPVFAMCPLFVWMLVFFTWRYVSIEYKYTVEAGVLKLYIVYGGKKKKEKASFRIKDAVGFIPLNEATDKLSEFNAEKTYNFLSSEKAPNEAYAFLIVLDGVKTAALIEAPAPSRKEILYYAVEDVRNGKVISLIK